MPTQKEIDKVAAETMDAAKEEMEAAGNVARRYDKVSRGSSADAKQKSVEKTVRKHRKAVVSGHVNKKKSLISRIKEGILPEDCDNFGDYIVDYVLVPYLRSAFTNAIDGLIPGWNPGGNKSPYRDYASAYRTKSRASDRPRNDEPVNYARFDWTDVDFDTPKKAQLMRRELLNAVNENIADGDGDFVSVLEFLDLARLGKMSTPTDYAVGWTTEDVKNAAIRPGRRKGKWIVDLPRPIQREIF